MDIVSIEYRVMRYSYSDWGRVFYEPGELLTMSDGSQWFHPYIGARPVQYRGATVRITKERFDT